VNLKCALESHVAVAHYHFDVEISQPRTQYHIWLLS